MRKIVITLTAFALIASSCRQTNSGKGIITVSDTTITENYSIFDNSIGDEEFDWNEFRKQSLNGFEKATLYNLTDTIITDFNGDGILDKAIFKKEDETSGVIIIHGQTNEVFRIGFGKPFAHMTEFNWVDYWGLVEDKETSENMFTEDGELLESKTVKLQNPSIVLHKDELGGGLITFKNGKYVWIHQTC